MPRKKFSEYPPEEAARMRAEISARSRAAWAARHLNGLGARKNGAQQEETRVIISQAVKRRWEEGRYDNRTNGMTGCTGARHPNWTWGKEHFREILEQFQAPLCAFCGATEHLNAHHVDEDHGNYLLSNLQWACVPCHAWRFHYGDKGSRRKAPFVTIGKRFTFEYAHVLPWHPGKCGRLHGHSGRLEVQLRARVDPHGVVEDFYDLSAAVKAAVIDPLDHSFLNDVLANPTSEELLPYIWQQLEGIGLKGLCRVTFSETDSSFVTVGVSDMVEAFGWDRGADGGWALVRKTDYTEGE